MILADTQTHMMPALALEMARAAARGGMATLVISREMVSAALARRMLSQEGRIRASSLKSGRIDDWNSVTVTARTLSGLPIWMSDSAVSIEQICNMIESTPQPIDFLVVDYLQLIRAPREIRERRLQVENVSQALKAIAVERKIPVLCLSSLSRPAEGKDRAPTLASLRESGELEHDADVVILLHRERGATDTQCVIGKNRDGETGSCRLIFRSEWVAFDELATEEHEADWHDEGG